MVHVLTWTILPLAVHAVPPGDNYEQLDWAEHLAWGYAKHPPLPTIVLWLFEQVFPAGIPLTFALAALQVSTMLFVTWWLTRKLLDDKRALVAVLFVSCITFYTYRLPIYNHNSALLVASAMSAAFVFKAAQTGKWRWYALLGLTWGLGLVSKYQMVVSIACNLIFLGWVARRDFPRLITRLVIAGCVCALVIAPHFLWLVRNHFPSFEYAATMVFASLPWRLRASGIISFSLDQLARVAPVGVVLLILRRFPSVRAAAAGELPASDASTLAARFLAVHAWGPLAIMNSLALLLGTDLQMHWGTAFLWTVPIWFLCTHFGRAITTLPIKTLFVAVVSLQILMLLVYPFQ